MEHLAPLLQTMLWVVLIGGIVIRFHKTLDALLAALTKRVEAGSTVKAGPFELSELRPQDPIQQNQRADAEIKELMDAEVEDHSNPPVDPNLNLRSRFYEAEDLALRAIQVEYREPITRQVATGLDMGFDGVFMADQHIHIVEVKYVVREKNAEDSVRRTLEALATFVRGHRWENVKLVIAVVFEYGGNLPAIQSRLNRLSEEFPLPVTVHCYARKELRKQFGLFEDANR